MTGHTTAKITAQHGLIYGKIAGKYGLEAAARYLSINQMALENYRVLCKEMQCDFEERDNFVYSMKSRDKLEREMRVLERIGAGAKFTENLPLPFPTCGAVSFPKQAQFHPLKFLAGISKNLAIYEHTKVCGFEGKTVMTEKGRIKAQRIIIATHFPMLNKHG